jgi:phytoene dehydrogenase-like protein
MPSPPPVADDHDAIVVGAGPNGLTAAAVLARAGWRVQVREAADTIGGGTRSAELTESGFVHDICSSIHPLGVASPAFDDLRLTDHGLEWIQPEAPLVHCLDRDRAVTLERTVAATAAGLGADGDVYRRFMRPAQAHADLLIDAALSPLSTPPARALPALARFGVSGAPPVTWRAGSRFRTRDLPALLGGLSAHTMLPLSSLGTAGFARFFALLGHEVGWPMARGGSQAIADALAAIIRDHGGELAADAPVRRLADLPPTSVVLLDLSPRGMLDLAGDRLPPRYRRALGRFRYGPGVFKLDWALDGPIPWAAEGCHRAATVHVGGSLDEVVASEAAVNHGRTTEVPFVLVVQTSLFDESRAPAGSHTAWAYCHVPSGWPHDMTTVVEDRIEHFAPGFRERILGRHTMGPADVERHDANYVGGDIGSGAVDVRQVAMRPVASRSPWRTPVRGLYLCSQSTPPGPGVHGMCGWHAAHAVLADFA